MKHNRMMPAETMSKEERSKNYKHLLKAMSPYYGQIALSAVFIVVSTVLAVLAPQWLSKLTDEIMDHAATQSIDLKRIMNIAIVLIVFYASNAILNYLSNFIMTTITQKYTKEVRGQISRKINRIPLKYYDSHQYGDTLSVITNDVDTLGQSLNQGVTQMITSITTLIGVVAMMVSINLVMTGITLVMLPVSLVLIMVVGKLSQKHFRAQQEKLGEINGQVEETFSGHAIVRAFNQEQACEERFEETNDKLYESAWKSQFLSGLMQPVMNFVGNLGYVAVALAGSVFAVQGAITVGDIQAFIQYVKNFTQPITQLTQVSNVLQQMAAAAERIFAFLEEEEVAPEEPKAQTSQVPCNVEFDHVRFGYSPDKPVINDFSAKVSEGQTVAIVGPTGAGKTTMVKLLMRFYDVDGGAIRIGGVDARDFSRSDVRSMFGMVLQDTWLFSGTISENIRYGKLDATDEEVEAAARAGCAHHFITTLPGGYDFVINEDATNISQGQRQLLTIARAILANRRMLILDEATSSVDTRTEERIQRAMDNLMEGRTSFVIAHRLSTIRSADLILVMQLGDIVEQGTHDELLARGGFYAELYNSQFDEGEE